MATEPQTSDFARRLVAATPKLRRTIWSLLRSQATADRVDDLTQETLLRAWKYQHMFDGTNLSGWLYRIARNWHISQARQHQTKTLSVPQFAEQLPDPRRTDERLEVAQALRLAKRLRPADREIFDRLLWGHTLEEIAIATNKPVGTIKSAYSRLRVQMRKLSEGA